jgi:nucleotide-binding universal stress UspA family protein
MFKHILIPHDGSELSRRAARAAVHLARIVGARVTSLYVQDLPSATDYTRFNANAVSPAEFRADEEARAKAVGTLVMDMAVEAGVPCETLTVKGDSPWEEIIRVAGEAGCDLIFMASHGRRGLAALVIGSETHKVLTHCRIPVMVYR